MFEVLKYKDKKKNVKPKLDNSKIQFIELFPKRKTISEKYKEELELEKLTRLLK